MVVGTVSDTRGPAEVAQALYAETEESRLRREAARATRAAKRAPETKPDKRARKLIRALGDIDAT